MTQAPPSRPSTIPIEALAAFPIPGMMIPNSLRFTVEGDHLLYLAATSEQPNQRLYALNCATGEVKVSATPPGDGTQEDKLSPEEELRRQRERMLAVGITHYSRARKSNRLLFPISGNVYVQEALYAPLRLVVDCAGQSPAQTPTFSPDGSFIAYVQADEVYVAAVDGGAPRQVTQGARGTGKTNGLAEYIAQEELHRSEGFWWSTDSQKLLYAEVDETHIPIYRIMHQGKDEVGESAQEDHRYPFAGAANAHVRLAVIDTHAKHSTPRWLDLDFGTEVYIARAFWWDAQTPGAQIINREQNTLWLVKFDLITGAYHVVLKETNNYWVNIRQDGFTLLNDGRFIWTSERDGFNHIYLYAPDGTLIRQLTSGDWMVDTVAALDEAQQRVYFVATKETPLEAHLYSASLLDEGDPVRITTTAGMHTVKISDNFSYFADLHHAINTPPTLTLYHLHNADHRVSLPLPADSRIAQFQLEAPELVSLTSRDGEKLYGAIYRPPAHFGDGPHPTIVYVYGGPGPQTVSNSWTLTAGLQAQYLRQQGYLIFRLDNRGSARRGIAFEGALKHRMGSIEVQDQVDGVRWLVEQGLTDPARVGVTGWSYGGYMALMCLAQAPDVFQVAVSGAPVTSWDGYDTAYTERYMGTPQSNPDGYHQGSVMTHIAQMRGKLLLVHGLLDENVHFRHTARLMNALNRARKPYDVLLFPDERHMPRLPADRVYLQQHIVEYFQKHL